MDISVLKKKIEDGLPGAHVFVEGDGRHMHAIVEYEGFKGKSMVEQHRMVFAVLEKELATEELHALALKTKIPA